MDRIETRIPAADGAPETPALAILPAGAKRGVVIIHEIYGRRPEIDRVVERFASAGYAAVAPDLFDRGRFKCLRELVRAMRAGGNEAVSITQGRNARAWLCDQTGIMPEHVGLIGFCFGGGYALIAGAGWAAVSTNYGPVPKASSLANVGPIIGCYGTRDRVMGKSPKQLERRLAQVGHDPAEIHLFDAGHSFLTDQEMSLSRRLALGMGMGDYPEARSEGWERIFAFFDRHLAQP